MTKHEEKTDRIFRSLTIEEQDEAGFSVSAAGNILFKIQGDHTEEEAKDLYHWAWGLTRSTVGKAREWRKKRGLKTGTRAWLDGEMR